MRRALLSISILILFTLVAASCTTTRWTTTDEHVTEPADTPTIIEQHIALYVDKEPSIEDPVLLFSAWQINKKEVTRRVQMERTVQKYRPRWGFFLLGGAGAAFAFLAANTNALALSSSAMQKTGLNIAGGLMGALALMNMKPDGPAIPTGEFELTKRSGVEVIRDSTRIFSTGNDESVDLFISLYENEIFTQTDHPLFQGKLEINLASLADSIRGRMDEHSEISVQVDYNGDRIEYVTLLSDFLAPFVHVSVPIAPLRNMPVFSEENIVTEVREGSFLELVREYPDGWYQIRYGGSDLYVQRAAGEVEWRSPVASGHTPVFVHHALPFGEVDVENAIPVLRSQNPDDRALILTNDFNHPLGSRQYLDRDHLLFEAYMKTALQMADSQIKKIALTPAQLSDLFPSMENRGSLIVYLSGHATVREEDSNPGIQLVLQGDNESAEEIALAAIFEKIADMKPEALYLFVDLGYQMPENRLSPNQTGAILEQAAGKLLDKLPNSVVLFSNRPGQQSSLYADFTEENRRHHIFNYYWAEALQQRKTRMADLIQHLENNVDYTSRRLHDRPQEIRAFGNFGLDLSE